MKKIVALVLLFCSVITHAQSIQRAVLASAGNTLIAGSNQLTFTIGETVITSLSAGSNIITQGFQQPGEQLINGSLSAGSFCAGSTVTVPYSAIDIGGGNIFTAQLSDANGSFANPIDIGSNPGNASGTITAVIPQNTVTGSAYRIRVISTAPGITATDNAGSTAGILVALSPNLWIGGSGNWSVNNNWCAGVVPTATANLLINTGNPQLDINYSAGGIMTINGAGALTVTPGKTLDIPNGGTVDFGGRPVTFQSTATGTASMGRIVGALNNASAVTVERYLPQGSITSPRTGKSWRLLTAPVSGTTVNAAWQEGSTWNGGAALSPTGFGTLITGGATQSTATIANGNGFDWWSAIAGATSSIRYHSGAAGPVNGAWLTPANTTGLNFTNNQGYLLYVRGDRSVSTAATGLATTLRATGTLKQGTFTPTLIPVLTSKFTLVGNPYASPIDLELFRNTNTTKIEDRFTIFDANLGLTGGYRLVERTGNNVYSVIPSLGAPPNPQYIQSGQAFFVEGKSGQSGTLSILETHKSSVVTNSVFLQDGGNSSTDMIAAKGRQAAASLNINLSIKNPDNSLLLADGAVVRISNAFNKLVTSEDAPKAYNISENLAIGVDTFRLISERRPILGKVDTIFLKLWGTAIKNYQFDITSSVLKGRTADLVDKFLGTSTPLKLDGSANSIGFSITSNTASKNIDRFYIVTPGTGPAAIDANNTSEESVKAGTPGMKAYPNPATGRNVSVLITNLEKGNYELSAFTTTGTKMITRKLDHSGGSVTIQIAIAQWSAGIYTLQLMNEEGVVVRTVSVVVSR